MTIPNNEVFSVDKASLIRRLKLHLPPTPRLPTD
jgi:hypothetical protein